MTEYLVKRTTNGPLPDWQAGDVVQIGQDGKAWGRRESLASWLASGGASADWPGGFYIIRVPDHSWPATNAYGEGSVSWVDISDPDDPMLMAQGRFSFALSEMTAQELDALAVYYSLTLDETRANALLLDRKHGARMTALLGA